MSLFDLFFSLFIRSFFFEIFLQNLRIQSRASYSFDLYSLANKFFSKVLYSRITSLLEDLIYKTFKILMKDLLQVFILIVAYIVVDKYTHNILINNFLCIIFCLYRIKGFVLLLLIYYVFQIQQNLYHLGSFNLVCIIGSLRSYSSQGISRKNIAQSLFFLGQKGRTNQQTIYIVDTD